MQLYDKRINSRCLVVVSVFVIVLMLFSNIYVFAQEGKSNDVTWKPFKDRKGLFTINYPSNWSPSSVTEPYGPIDIDFFYNGKQYAWVNIFARETIFSNATDSLDSQSVMRENNYEVERAVECNKYTINGAQACSRIESYQNQDPNLGYLAFLNVAAIDNNGIEYVFTYQAGLDVFKTLLPVAEAMLKSFKVTGNIPTSSTTTDTLTTTTNQGMTGAEFTIEDESAGNNITSPHTSNIPQNNGNITQPINLGFNQSKQLTPSNNTLTGADFSMN